LLRSNERRDMSLRSEDAASSVEREKRR
jgi:hypothetical protein